LRKLEHKYANELTVIGVHSAKFPNEKEKENLYNAVRRYELEHPVVNDAEFQVWQQYACRAWPTMMFIDPQGKVIGKHEGEITYEDLDRLLGEMVAEFDASGLLDRRTLAYSTEVEPDTPLSFPGKVLADETGGRLFIADSNHNRIVVTTLDGSVTHTIGSGQEGLADGDFVSAQFNNPQGLALAGDVLYVADTENHALRMVHLEAGNVTTIVGNGIQGRRRSGHFPGNETELISPWDLVFHDDKLYIAMAGCHQLWVMDLQTGMVGPFAGSGAESISDGALAEATLAQPSGITTDGNRLYFVDSETSAVRSAELDSRGRVRTIVGLGLFEFGDRDGEGHHVRLQHPLGITMRDGALYITDSYNHKIKLIMPVPRSATTLVGAGAAGFVDGDAEEAAFSEPAGLSIAGDKMYIADTNNHAIRVANIETWQVSTLQLSWPG
jgi:DNA-binding beta-propeller fold protein YncE